MKTYTRWTSDEQFKAALLQFIEECGTPGEMPRYQEFVSHRRTDLSAQITKRGGMKTVAQGLGLSMAGKSRIRGEKAAQLEELKLLVAEFNAKHGIEGRLPTNKEVTEASAGRIEYLIERVFGGYLKVSALLGLPAKKTVDFDATLGAEAAGWWHSLSSEERIEIIREAYERSKDS